jgi:5-methylcytosine-specific restriction endonuclease McrA
MQKLKSKMFNPRKLPNSNPLKKILGYSSREPIPADKKKAVLERAGNRCEVCGEKPYGTTLEFHHKNMKSSDNRLSNLQLLCPNHHRFKHSRKRRVCRTDALGRETSRLVKKTTKTTRKKPRRAKSTRGDFENYLKRLP